MMAGSDVTPVTGARESKAPTKEDVDAWLKEAGKSMASNVWNEVRKDLNSGTGVKKRTDHDRWFGEGSTVKK
jgi:hypothetical protein